MRCAVGPRNALLSTMPQSHLFEDARGRFWLVYDYLVEGLEPNAKTRSVAVGDARATLRVFVPVGRTGAALSYTLGYIPNRDTSEHTLENQLRSAKPIGESAADQTTDD